MPATNSFKQVQLQPFSFAGAGASIGDTTIVLSSFADINGVLLTMADFGLKGFATCEPGSAAQEESITFTGVTQNGNGTATLTGVSYQLMKDPYTETSGLSKSHAGGTSLVISNTAGFYQNFLRTGDDQTIDGILTFNDSPIVPTPTTASQVATKDYVDNVAITGGPKAGFATYGIVRTSSAPLVASQPVVLNAEEVSAVSGTSVVVRANASGKIDKGFIELSQNKGLVFTGNGLGAVAGTAILVAADISVNVGTGANQVVQLDANSKIPAVDGSQLTGIWEFISTATGSSSSSSGVPSAATVAIPTGTKYIIIQCSTQKDEGTDNTYYIAGQLFLIPTVITSGIIRDLYGTTDEAFIHFTATISGTNISLTSNVAGGGGATARFDGVCYFFK